MAANLLLDTTKTLVATTLNKVNEDTVLTTLPNLCTFLSILSSAPPQLSGSKRDLPSPLLPSPGNSTKAASLSTDKCKDTGFVVMLSVPKDESEPEPSKCLARWPLPSLPAASQPPMILVNPDDHAKNPDKPCLWLTRWNTKFAENHSMPMMTNFTEAYNVFYTIAFNSNPTTLIQDTMGRIAASTVTPCPSTEPLHHPPDNLAVALSLLVTQKLLSSLPPAFWRHSTRKTNRPPSCVSLPASLPTPPPATHLVFTSCSSHVKVILQLKEDKSDFFVNVLQSAYNFCMPCNTGYILHFCPNSKVSSIAKVIGKVINLCDAPSDRTLLF
eukprot:jgi/Psemu1/5912/gm1.5912_g